jgi:hypothetical protein
MRGLPSFRRRGADCPALTVKLFEHLEAETLGPCAVHNLTYSRIFDSCSYDSSAGFGRLLSVRLQDQRKRKRSRVSGIARPARRLGTSYRKLKIPSQRKAGNGSCSMTALSVINAQSAFDQLVSPSTGDGLGQLTGDGRAPAWRARQRPRPSSLAAPSIADNRSAAPTTPIPYACQT